MYLPEIPWLPVNPDVRSCHTDGRTVKRYLEVVRQFNVERHPRYKVRDGNHDGKDDTYCNVFVSDVGEAYGLYLPHWHLNMEFSANRLIDWFRSDSDAGGTKYGWEEHTPHETMGAVMEGIFGVVTHKNPSGIGHVAVVLPIETSDDSNPYIAQAGRTNFVGRRLTDGFGDKPVRFFTCR